jgi:hypothetical protein
VREGVSKPFVALLAAVIVAALLTACGGSDSTSSGSSTATVSTPQNGSSGSSQQGNSRHEQGNGSQGGNGGQGGGHQQGGSSAAAAPLQVSGGGSGQYRTKGGDNSIQNFGEESGESELREAAEALHAFYVARAEEEWSRACSYLSKTVSKQLEQLAAQSPQLRGKGCAAVLKAFTQPLPAATRRETTEVDAGSLRVEGERSFLIYTGAEGTAYAMPMQLEGGTWKAGLLSPTPLG